ncbi:MAG: hypothetical protein AB203_01450 [Parcubacteria bacterium C7867-008]|nr:MAG: hypothetical protein AB203_01450 [Parcubacteria bacterium C7867-008]
MSIERAIKRNKKTEIDGKGFPEHRLIPSSERQKELTAEWILPYEEVILEDARDIRKQVDRSLPRTEKIRERSKKFDRPYPKGFCGEIRNAVLEDMKLAMMDRSKPGMQALRGFVRQGGVIQPFWGIDNGMYFQNAIQIGDAILDVANDTVDTSKEPVVFYPNQSEAPIKRINNFTEFADVAESYWDTEVYPNIYLPHLAPLYPVLILHRAGKGKQKSDRLYLEQGVSDLMVDNLRSVTKDDLLFGLSSNFLFKSPYSEKRLPDDILEAMFSNEVIKEVQGKRPDAFATTTDPEIARQEFHRFHKGADINTVYPRYVKEAEEMRRNGYALAGFPIAKIMRF